MMLLVALESECIGISNGYASADRLDLIFACDDDDLSPCVSRRCCRHGCSTGFMFDSMDKVNHRFQADTGNGQAQVTV